MPLLLLASFPLCLRPQQGFTSRADNNRSETAPFKSPLQRGPIAPFPISSLLLIRFSRKKHLCTKSMSTMKGGGGGTRGRLLQEQSFSSAIVAGHCQKFGSGGLRRRGQQPSGEGGTFSPWSQGRLCSFPKKMGPEPPSPPPPLLAQTTSSLPFCTMTIHATKRRRGHKRPFRHPPSPPSPLSSHRIGARKMASFFVRSNCCALFLHSGQTCM